MVVSSGSSSLLHSSLSDRATRVAASDACYVGELELYAMVPEVFDGWRVLMSGCSRSPARSTFRAPSDVTTNFCEAG